MTCKVAHHDVAGTSCEQSLHGRSPGCFHLSASVWKEGIEAPYESARQEGSAKIATRS